MSHRVSMLPEQGGCVREETVGASLDTGGDEVASELWTERVFYGLGMAQSLFPAEKYLSRLQRSFTVIIEGGIGLIYNPVSG